MKFGQFFAKFDWIDAVQLLRTRWSIALLIGSLVLLAGEVGKSFAPMFYEAKLVLDLGPPAGEGDFPADPRGKGPRPLSPDPKEVGTREMLNEVAVSLQLAERWGAKPGADLATMLESRVRVESSVASPLVTVMARDSTRNEAAFLANALGEKLLSRKAAEAKNSANERVVRYGRDREACEERIAGIEKKLLERAKAGETESEEVAALRRSLASQGNLLHSLDAKRQLAMLEANGAALPARVVAPATPAGAVPLDPWWAGVPTLVLISAACGLLATFVSHRGEARWCLVAELMKRLDVPVVGFAPLSGISVVASKDADLAGLEPYRDLRNRLLRLPSGECNLITVLPARGNGAIGEPVVNLACVLADAGRTTLVIDANFRSPSLHVFFDAAQHPGLSDFLSGEMRLEETVVRSRRPNLWFMPTGPRRDDPGALLVGRRMDDLVWDLRSRFDFILVTSPALHEVSDAVLLAGMADCCVVATPYAGLSWRALRETKSALETVPAVLGGILLTRKVTTFVEMSPQTRPSPTSLAQLDGQS